MGQRGQQRRLRLQVGMRWRGGAVRPAGPRLSVGHLRATLFQRCSPQLKHSGVLVERQVLGPRRVSDSGSGLGRVPRDADAPGPSSSWEPRPWLGRPLPDRGGLQRSHLAHERALF